MTKSSCLFDDPNVSGLSRASALGPTRYRDSDDLSARVTSNTLSYNSGSTIEGIPDPAARQSAGKAGGRVRDQLPPEVTNRSPAAAEFHPGHHAESDGDVQHPEPQELGLNDSHRTGQCEQPKPGCQFGGDRHDLQPSLVSLELPRWKWAEAGVFGMLDAVLNASVGTVPGVPKHHLLSGGVGREGLAP